MEVRPETSFTLRMTEGEFKLLSACVALCAGVKGVRVDRAEAHALNLLLTENRARHAEEQAKIANGAVEKARAHQVEGEG